MVLDEDREVKEAEQLMILDENEAEAKEHTVCEDHSPPSAKRKACWCHWCMNEGNLVTKHSRTYCTLVSVQVENTLKTHQVLIEEHALEHESEDIQQQVEQGLNNLSDLLSPLHQ